MSTLMAQYLASVVTTAWPEAGIELLDELRGAPGRVALIDTRGLDADQMVQRLQDDLDISSTSLGRQLASRSQPPTLADLEETAADAVLLTDLDLLFWPTVGVDPLTFLAFRSRQRATIGVWPGSIEGRTARYGAPGRPDYYERTLSDVVVLRQVTTRYPDEVPYTIERVAP